MRPQTITTVALLTLATTAFGRPVPAPSSPGSTTAFLRIGDPCPTFSWAAGSSGDPVRLLVYRVRLSDDAAGLSSTRVFDLALPSGATGWTPSLDRCLSAGLYAWQAVAPGRESEPPAMFFQLGTAGARTEIAGRRLQEHLAGGGTLDALSRRSNVEWFEPAPAGPPRGPARPQGERVARAGGTDDGAIVADSFQYSVPATLVHRTPGDRFLPSSGSWTRAVQSIFVQGTSYLSSAVLNAPVQLPEGATVTKLTCYHYDDDVDNSALWITSLRRRGLNATLTTSLAAVTNNSSGRSSFVKQASSSAITNPVVANSNFSYLLSTDYIHDFGNGAELPALRFFGCAIDYQLEEPSAR